MTSQIQIAKRLYHQHARVAERLGPIFRGHKTSDQDFAKWEHLWEQFGPNFADAMVVKEKSSGAPIWNVSSPWHAAITLSALLAKTGNLDDRGKPIDLPSGRKAVELEWTTKLLFRGQSDANWKLCPTLYRDDVTETERVHERRALCLFQIALEALFKYNTLPRPSPEAFEAAARHYGLKSSLLDFTFDPDVAIYFASQSTSSNRGRIATVFMISLEQAKDFGLEMTLPPPLAHRAYAQRATFLRTPEDRLAELHAETPEIRFPAMCGFKVLRGRAAPNLLRGQEWIKRIINEARKRTQMEVHLPQSDYEKSALADSMLRVTDVPTGLVRGHDELRTYVEWLDELENMTYWACLSLFRGNEYFNPNAGRLIVKWNRQLIECLIEAYRRFACHEPNTQRALALQRTVEYWSEILAEE